MKRPWTLCRLLGRLGVTAGVAFAAWIGFAVVKPLWAEAPGGGPPTSLQIAPSLFPMFYLLAIGAALERLDAIAWHAGETRRLKANPQPVGDSEAAQGDAT